MDTQNAYALADDSEVPPSQRPTVPPPSLQRHESGVRLKAPRSPSFIPPIPRSEPPPPSIDPRWVPIIADRRSLSARPPGLTTFMVLACINGVLSTGDISQMTGIPLGAVLDVMDDLYQRGVVIWEKPRL